MTPIDPLAKFSIADDAWFEDPNEGVSRTIYLFNYAYQLCAAEKQAEIDALTARIAPLEQQRQQDREDAKAELLKELADNGSVISAARAKEPRVTNVELTEADREVLQRDFERDIYQREEPHHEDR